MKAKYLTNEHIIKISLLASSLMPGLGNSEWTEQIKHKISGFENSDGLLKFRFEVTAYQDECKEFCKTIIYNWRKPPRHFKVQEH